MARRITLPSADDLFGSESDKVAPRPAPNGTARAKHPAGVSGGSHSGEPRATRAPRRETTATAPPTEVAPPAATARRPTARKPTARKPTARKPTAHKAAPRTAAAGRPADRPQRTGAERPAPRARTAQTRTAIERMRTVEARLNRLPVDMLIDLRDGLEDLLSTADVDVDALETLLDTVGA